MNSIIMKIDKITVSAPGKSNHTEDVTSVLQLFDSDVLRDQSALISENLFYVVTLIHPAVEKQRFLFSQD